MPAVVLLAVVAFLACAQFGGGLYEHRVLDPVWPGRPAIIQPQHGGISRRRFWVPARAVFEVSLVVALVWSWGYPHVRTALLVAVASHLAVRIWSVVDLNPKSIAFEKGDPAVMARSAGERWTRRSMLRLPLDAITGAATMAALVLAA